MDHEQADLTRMLQAAVGGDEDAESRFCRAVYDELHKVASQLVAKGNGSLQASSLVHELFLKMFRRNSLKKAHNRRYFFAVAIDQMRKLLIDYHRKRNRQKAGGGWDKIPLNRAMSQVLTDFENRNGCDVESLEQALVSLRDSNERAYQVVIHRFYGGLTNQKTAQILGVSVGTIERDWRLARAKLLSFLKLHSS